MVAITMARLICQYCRVKNKMDSGDGMNFAEFCYPIMQAWDWWYMYDTKNIQMQIGGSDQYGNIVAGVEAVKYMAKTHPDPDIRQAGGVEKLTTPFGLTVPLLTSSSGEKFGKSAGNAIWLDSNMTSYFDLYAFFVRTADADVERYLKLFTFMPENKIQGIMDQHKNNTSKRVAQHTLAFEFLHLVHGQENAEFARGQYEKQAASRNKASLSSLMSASDLHTAAHEGEPSAHDINGETSTTAKLDETPSHYSQDAFTPPLAPDNILSMNQDPGTRIRSKFTSPVLNPYAPVSNPNTASGSAAHIILPASLIRDQSIAKVLYSAGLVTSRSEGHRLAQGKGAYIGRRSSGHKQMTEEIDFVPVKLADPHLTWDSIIRDHEKTKLMDKKGEEGLLVLRNGKWKVRMIRVVSDEQFECLNLPDPPLWQEFKSQLARKRAEDGIDETKGWKGKRASDPEPTANDHEIAPAKASARTDLSQSTWTEPTARVQDRVASKQRYFQVGRAYDTLKQRERDERRLGPQQAHLPSQSRGLHTSSYPRGSDNDVDQAKASGAKPKLRKMPGEIHPAELRKRHAIKMSLLAQARFRGNQAVLNDMREDSKAARVAEAKRMERMSARAEWDEEDRLFRNAGKEPGAVDQTQRTECAANDTRVRKRAGKKTHAKRSVTDEELGREYFDKEGSEPGMKVKRLPDMDPKSEEYSALKRRYVDMQTHDDGQKIRDEVRAREQERDEATFMDVDGHGLHEAYAQQEYSRADDRLASTGSSKTKDDHNNKLSNWQKRSKYSMRENHPDAAEAMIKVQAERDWSRRRMERVRMSFESMRTKAARMQDAFGGRGWGDKGDS